MKTAVVILNWNGRNHLARFLGSVVDNTPAEIDIVVADNGSTDDSVAFLRQEYPSVRLILLDKNYGFATGYNLALREIKADCYILLNSDVEVTAGWTKPLLNIIQQDRWCGAVAPKLLSYTARDKFEYAGAA
jgi:GT2 family glycosyltransferase